MLSVKYNELMSTREMARALGRKGGRARAARLGPADRKRIAALGGIARRKSLQVARRILETLAYAQVLAALRPAPPVTRVRRWSRRLPGIYADQR